jgi:glycosyltransferase involved in cell wall biosynthesis
MRISGTSESRRGLDPAEKLRVLHVVDPSFGRQFSGHTHYVFSLLSGWRDRDIVLDMWGSSVRPLNVGSGNRNYELAAQLWPAKAPSRGRFEKVVEYVRQLAFLAAHARSFDLVHFHSLTWATLVSPLLLHLYGKKAIFNSTLCGSDNPSAVAQQIGGRWASRFLRQFDGILTISPLLEEDYLASGFGTVACIPHFLALPQLERGHDAGAQEELRRELSIPAGAIVLLFVGAVIHRKGVDLLAESFARLAERHRDLWLIVVGPNSRTEAASYDEVLAQTVKRTIDRVDAYSRVIWTGTVRDKNVLARCYSAADIFVFPTRAEGLANVLIEASAAGLPTVATDLRGVTDVPVADGETGFLVPPEDIDALTQAIEQLVTDPSLRTKMGRAARERSKRFGFEDYCRRLKAFYLQVAMSPNGEPEKVSVPQARTEDRS